MTNHPGATCAFSALAIFAVSACHSHGTVPSTERARPQGSNMPAVGMPSINRTDSELLKAIARELHRDTNIDSGELHIGTENGIVQLRGTVDNLLSKERAARLAEVVRGVRSVDNLIEVVPPLRPDPDIEADVRNALKHNAATARMPISVRVMNAVARLTGTVTSRQERQFAERLADGVRGVRFTKNDITTKPNEARSAAEISNDIRSRLAWDVLVEHDPITVALKGGHVTLSGRTGSAAERSRASNDAWVDGVTAVDATALLVTPLDRPDENVRIGEPTTDEQIRKAIQDAVRYDPRLRSFSMTPDVTAGVVTLRGSVQTLSARAAAEALARNTVGVKAVKNDLVARSAKPLADELLEDRVNETLAFDPLTDARDIHPIVSSGKVTLTGSVGTYFESAEALDDTSGLASVARVDNKLRVRSSAEPYVHLPWADQFLPNVDAWDTTSVPTLSDSAVEQRIRENFSWSPFIRQLDVTVTVKGGTATLSGTVGGFRARQAAIDKTLEAGAVSVRDEMKVDQARSP